MNKNRFKQLLESTMGNVKPLINEQNIAGGSKDIHPDDWISQGLEDKPSEIKKPNVDWEALKSQMRDTADNIKKMQNMTNKPKKDDPIPQDNTVVTLDTIADVFRKKGCKLQSNNPNYDLYLTSPTLTVTMDKDNVLRVNHKPTRVQSTLYTFFLKKSPYYMKVEKVNGAGKQVEIESDTIYPKELMSILNGKF